MLTLEDRQRLRALATSQLPQRDLWPAISSRIASKSRAPRHRYGWLALAASLAGAAVLSGLIGIHMTRAVAERGAVAQPQSIAHIASANPRAARWNPGDPRLRGAAVELHTAQGELQQALAIAPHSPYLQRLLDGTRQEQARLRQLDLDAG